MKYAFADVSREDVLARLRTMPIRTWSYRVNASSVRHLGPTAQDFHAAFGLGDDDRTIAGVDAQGVALAGVQELDARSQRQQAEIDALRAENAGIRQENIALRARLDAIEALLARP